MEMHTKRYNNMSSLSHTVNTCLCNHKIKAAKAHEAKVTVDTKDSLNQR